MRDGIRREVGRVLENIVPNDEQMCLSNVSGSEGNVENVEDDEGGTCLLYCARDQIAHTKNGNDLGDVHFVWTCRLILYSMDPCPAEFLHFLHGINPHDRSKKKDVPKKRYLHKCNHLRKRYMFFATQKSRKI